MKFVDRKSLLLCDADFFELAMFVCCLLVLFELHTLPKLVSFAFVQLNSKKIL